MSRRVRTATITVDILESFLQCRYKSHLQLGGAQGMPSDYERLMREKSARVRLVATDKLLTRHRAREILRSLPVTPAVLNCGVSLVLDATMEDEGLALCCDALQRVPGPSKLGDFHYIPVLFHEGRGWKSAQPPIELIPEGFTLSRRKRSRDWDQVQQQPYRKKQE